MNKKWKESYDKIQGRVEKAVKGECFVKYSAYQKTPGTAGIPIDNLDAVAVKGKVFFVQPHHSFWGKGKNYISKTVQNPTWLDVAVLANDMIKTVGDKHHVFLEEIEERHTYYDKTKQLHFSMGS